MTEIHDAVRNDDCKALKELLSQDKTQVNIIIGDMKNTPLHTAASKGLLEIVQILLNTGADNTLCNRRGSLPIHLAITHNHQEIIKLLISQDKNQLNVQDRAGNTPLHFAVTKRRPEIVEYLLNHQARVDITNNEGNKVYHVAVLWNRPFILSMLLNYNSTYVNDMNSSGYTALHLAAMKNMEECIQCLLIFEANPQLQDKFGETPANYGSEDTQKIFVKFKLYRNIKASCISGMTSILAMRKYIDDSLALHIVASFSDSSSLIQQLISNGSQVNAHDAKGKTPLYYAFQSGCLNNIRALISAGGRCSELHMENEKTPLHFAIQRNNLKLAEYLLNQRCNVDACDKSGDTPLLYAIANHFRNGVKLLLNHGAIVTHTDKHGNTPLHLSVTANNYNITKDILHITTQNIDSYNSYGHTPLMCAILGRNAKLTNLLLHHGAHLHLTDKNGKSAMTLALDTNLKSLIEVVVNFEKENDSYDEQKE